MPFGVCVVYRWISEFEAMIVCFDQSLSRKGSNYPTIQELLFLFKQGESVHVGTYDC